MALADEVSRSPGVRVIWKKKVEGSTGADLWLVDEGEGFVVRSSGLGCRM